MSTTTVAPPVTGRAPAQPVSRALLERVRTWSYYRTADVASRRDLRLDLLRGFCIFAMVVDHFGGDSWLYAITGGNRFYVSAAEGFIFISGFVMGQAYRSNRDRRADPHLLVLIPVHGHRLVDRPRLRSGHRLAPRDLRRRRDPALHVSRHGHPGDVHPAAPGSAADPAAAVSRRV